MNIRGSRSYFLKKEKILRLKLSTLKKYYKNRKNTAIKKHLILVKCQELDNTIYCGKIIILTLYIVF